MIFHRCLPCFWYVDPRAVPPWRPPGVRRPRARPGSPLEKARCPGSHPFFWVKSGWKIKGNNTENDGKENDRK